MIFRFIMLSDEVDNFKREYKLDAEATFLDLRNVIVESVGYDKSEMSSFLLCDDNWNKETEITLVDMGSKSEEDSYIMEDSILGDFLEDEKQKLMFVFDYLNGRAFFMELREIIFGENADSPQISKSVGTAPSQNLILEEEPIIAPVVPITPLIVEDDDDDNVEVDDFYGDDDYNDDELDDDSFDEFDEEGETDANIEELDNI